MRRWFYTTMQDKEKFDFDDNSVQDYLWRLIKEDDEEIVRRLEEEVNTKKNYWIQVISVIVGVVGVLLTMLTLVL